MARADEVERDDRAPIGVLLSNLGTPASPSAKDVARFLDEFLSDPAVVRLPRWFWLPFLRRVVLPRRAPRSAELYASIWTGRGSPLMVNSVALRAALAEELGDRFRVELGMRYGSPSLEDGIAALERAGCRTIVLAALYPQSSTTTDGTTHARAEELVRARFDGVELVLLGAAPTDELYVDALTERVRSSAGDRVAGHHVFSFHGLPESYVRAGDRYPDACRATSEALATRLGLAPEEWTLAYQSRFGPTRWIGPETRAVVLELAKEHELVQVTMPGFAADCLETLEEIGARLGEEFAAVRGGTLVVTEALNAHPAWVRSLARRIRASLDARA